MDLVTLSSRKLIFGYGQFIVTDAQISNCAFLWSEENMNQGFARQESVASFVTLEQFGVANLTVFLGSYPTVFLGGYPSGKKHERVIAVPFNLVSGSLLIEGPEEAGLIEPLKVAKGAYRLVSAQTLLSAANDEEPVLALDLYLEKKEKLPDSSTIIIQDKQLNPSFPLLEFTAIHDF